MGDRDDEFVYFHAKQHKKKGFTVGSLIQAAA